jgi:hypothetical protein
MLLVPHLPDGVDGDWELTSGLRADLPANSGLRRCGYTQATADMDAVEQGVGDSGQFVDELQQYEVPLALRYGGIHDI